MSRLSPFGEVRAMTLYETLSLFVAILTLIVSILGLLK
jgi:hypothetical protein